MKRMYFISLDIIEHLLQNTKVIKEIERLIDMYNIRNHIEIEKKYTVEDPQMFNVIIDKLNSWEEKDYNIAEPEKIEQTDYYYDTPSGKLGKNQITLRVRHKNNKEILTIKTPTEESNDRFEYEKNLRNKDLAEAENLKFISRYIPNLTDKDIRNLKRKIKIVNDREERCIKNGNVEFEMVFDDVIYENLSSEKKHHEYQIEVELKSDYPHRVNLNLLANYLENNFDEDDLISIKESKYRRALKFTS